MATQVPFNNQVATQASSRVAPAPGIWYAPSMYSGLPPVPLAINRRTNTHKPPLQWTGRPAVAAGDWGTGAGVNFVGGVLAQGTGLDNAVPSGVSTAINPLIPGSTSAPVGDRQGGAIFSTPVRAVIGGVLG